jgi:hypothetical protein
MDLHLHHGESRWVGVLHGLDAGPQLGFDVGELVRVDI